MDSQNKFQMGDFPIEKEFRILAVRERLHELTRENLEEFLSEALLTMTKLGHQVTELRDYVEKIEGKPE